MLQAISIMISGVWGILSVNIPVSENITFTLWQFFFFIMIVMFLLKRLFSKGVEK